jgi:hypothetical protein
MGLDIVEFVIAVEGAFGIHISDSEAARLETPRLLIDYVAQRLEVAPIAHRECLTQRAFYRSRAAIARRFHVERRSLWTSSRLKDVVGKRKNEWKALGRDIGAAAWPRIKSENPMFAALGGVSTVGELAANLATYDAAALRDPHAPWSVAEIEAIVRQLIDRELSVDMSKHTLDSTFIRDMGCG